MVRMSQDTITGCANVEDLAPNLPLGCISGTVYYRFITITLVAFAGKTWQVAGRLNESKNVAEGKIATSIAVWLDLWGCLMDADASGARGGWRWVCMEPNVYLAINRRMPKLSGLFMPAVVARSIAPARSTGGNGFMQTSIAVCKVFLFLSR